MNRVSLESMLSLVDEPNVDWSAIEELAEDVCEALHAAEDALSHGPLPTTAQALSTIRAGLSSFHELRLVLASDIEDFQTWGGDWRRYAARHVPREYKVRLVIERANAASD